MKQILGTVLSLLILTCLDGIALPAGWGTNFVSSLEESGTRQQPLLVYFTASWCGPCKLMARTTLASPAVLEALKGVNHVALDLDEQPKLAERYAIQAVPTFLMLAPSGESVATTTGYQDEKAFLGWLTHGVGETLSAVARQKEVDQTLAQVDGWMSGSERPLLQKAVASLLELCAERNEATRQKATDRLATLAARDATLLLDGLKHPRLSVRILISNALRKQIGASFNVDPWSDTATRAQGVVVWREKLGAKRPSEN